MNNINPSQLELPPSTTETRKPSDLDSNYSSSFEDEETLAKEPKSGNAEDDGVTEKDTGAAENVPDMENKVDNEANDDVNATSYDDNLERSSISPDNAEEQKSKSVTGSQSSLKSAASERSNNSLTKKDSLVSDNNSQHGQSRENTDISNHNLADSQTSLRSTASPAASQASIRSAAAAETAEASEADDEAGGVDTAGSLTSLQSDHEDEKQATPDNHSAKSDRSRSIASDQSPDQTGDKSPAGSQTSIRSNHEGQGQTDPDNQSMKSDNSDSEKEPDIVIPDEGTTADEQPVETETTENETNNKIENNDDNVSVSGSVKTEFIGNDIPPEDNDLHIKEDNNEDAHSLSSTDDEKDKQHIYNLFDSDSDQELSKRRLQRQETKLQILDYPAVVTDFNSLHLHQELLTGIHDAGFEKPTELQSTCLPQAMKWKDCIIQGPPGVGKSTVYTLSTLHLLPRTTRSASARSGIRVLVVCPTKELVLSVYEQYTLLQKHMTNASVLSLTSGAGKGNADKNILRKNRPNILIGTPGRISAAIKSKSLSLSQMKTLVVEAADMMLNPNIAEFRVFFQKIAKKNKKKQVILTCTTPQGNMEKFRELLSDEPFEYLTENQNLMPKTLNQYYLIVPFEDEKEKEKQLIRLLKETAFNQVLIFTNSGISCSQVVDRLVEENLAPISIYGSMTPHDRVKNYESFRNSEAKILVATDAVSSNVIGRDVNLVINYEETLNGSIHFHRVTKAVPSFTCERGVAVTFLQEEGGLDGHQEAYGFTAQPLPEELGGLLVPRASDSESAIVNYDDWGAPEDKPPADQTQAQDQDTTVQSTDSQHQVTADVEERAEDAGHNTAAAAATVAAATHDIVSEEPPMRIHEQKEKTIEIEETDRMASPQARTITVAASPDTHDNDKEDRQDKTVTPPPSPPRQRSPSPVPAPQPDKPVRSGSASSRRSNKVAPHPVPTTERVESDPDPARKHEYNNNAYDDSGEGLASGAASGAVSVNGGSPSKAGAQKPQTMMGFSDPKQKGPSEEKKGGCCVVM